MAGIEREGGILAVDGLDCTTLAEAWGTPTYIYSAALIEARYAAFCKAILPVNGPPNGPQNGKVHYAIKANSNQAVLRLLARLGAGADIVSYGEMRRALAAGFSPDDIVFSGIGKTDADIIAALTAGVGQINAESESEVDRVLTLAGETGKTCRLALRINPDITPATHAKISTGHAQSKFGIPLTEAPALYRRVDRCRHVTAGGLAVHIGSQIMTPEPFEDAWLVLRDLADALVADGLDVPMLDLGGGLGVDYEIGGLNNPPPHDHNDHNAHTGLAALGEVTRRLFGGRDFRLGFEPGRWLVAEAGVLLARIIHIKESRDKVFYIVDAGMNDLIRPTLYDAFHRIEAVTPRGGDARSADIVGPICESGDYLGQGRMMPPAKAGDLLAVLSAGAYGAVMRSAYNTRPPAMEVMVIDGEAYPVSVRQSVEDLLALEHIPPPLA